MKNEHINVAELADQPRLEDYEQKPVENYGMALLKGMGFDQSKGIGKRKKNQLAQIFVLKPRPKGLGLGAETNQQKVVEAFQIGDRVLITQQPHKGLTGLINEAVDEDNFSIQLHPSKSIVKIAKKALKKISKSEMKQLQEELTKQKTEQKSKKKLKWVTPQIRVKIINPKSEYYLKKVIVTDLISNREFECRDQNGKVFTEFTEADVQTVIPKTGTVLILRGSHKGNKATIIDRKKSKGRLTVQTQQQLQILKLEEDDISEYIQL